MSQMRSMSPPSAAFWAHSSDDWRGEASRADGGVGGDPAALAPSTAGDIERGAEEHRSEEPAGEADQRIESQRAPRSSAGAAATSPAVSVPDSAMTSIE